MYSTFFDREADEGGLNYWTGELSNGKSKRAVFAGFAFFFGSCDASSAFSTAFFTTAGDLTCASATCIDRTNANAIKILFII